MNGFQQFLKDNLNTIFTNESPTDSLLVDLGNSIKQKRKTIGLSQKDLAHATKISQANLSRIECGLSNISINQLRRIADALHVKIKVYLE